MKTSTEDVAIATWKQQLDGAVRIIEAVTEGSMKIRDLQLKAATDAHKRLDEVRKQIGKAADAQDLWRIQSEWMAASVEGSLHYWNELNQATVDTQSVMNRYWYAPGVALPQATNLPNASKTALVLMDDAYKRWHDATLQLWSAADPTPAAGRHETAAHKSARQES